MDEMNNNESPRTPERRRRKPAPKSSIPMPAFLSRIGEDVKWYYDVRLWLPLFLILLLLAMCSGGGQETNPENVPPETTVVETQPEVETEPPQVSIDPQAEALAILAESVGAGRSNNVKTIIMWVAINRMEDRANGYGASLMEEIARPNQWQGYDSSMLYTQEVYDIAVEVLDTVANGGLRPLDNDMLWFVLNDNGSITVRNQFTATGNQKWNEKTIR